MKTLISFLVVSVVSWFCGFWMGYAYKKWEVQKALKGLDSEKIDEEFNQHTGGVI